MHPTTSTWNSRPRTCAVAGPATALSAAAHADRRPAPSGSAGFTGAGVDGRAGWSTARALRFAKRPGTCRVAAADTMGAATIALSVVGLASERFAGGAAAPARLV